ncbi:hypothetical protein H8L32_02980 [Undibacterium sp. CY18W]|uniref:Uncharacterized protein n=1 Tax=Undibacterium hunanense TaxID=2762292 RepID=A0ABR6ZKM0_9BURK|nr:hypothetical protein [Undibacterium hunanense]MBC3916443.1 hypothetical protein [Undibacterium hunanense]
MKKLSRLAYLRIVANFLFLSTFLIGAFAMGQTLGSSTEVAPEKLKVQLFTDPSPDIATTRRVGDNLVRFGAIRDSTTTIPKGTIKLLEPASSTWGFLEMFRKVSARPGLTGMLTKWRDEGYPMICVNPAGQYETDLGKMAGCFVDTDNDGKFDVSVYPTYNIRHKMDAPAAYELVTETKTIETRSIEEFDYVTEMLYQGVSKGEIRISYREFKGGLARPAFTQDLTYEIDPDGTSVIVFRDVKLKVLKANREEITYVLVRPNYQQK